jgi:hypothetical protein
VALFFEKAAVRFDADEGVVDLNSKAGLDNFIAAAMQHRIGIANLGSVVQADRLPANVALTANSFGDDPLGSVGPMPAPRSFDRQKSALVSAWRGSPLSTLLGSNVRALAVIPGSTGMGAARDVW